MARGLIRPTLYTKFRKGASRLARRTQSVARFSWRKISRRRVAGRKIRKREGGGSVVGGGKE